MAGFPERSCGSADTSLNKCAKRMEQAVDQIASKGADDLSLFALKSFCGCGIIKYMCS